MDASRENGSFRSTIARLALSLPAARSAVEVTASHPAMSLAEGTCENVVKLSVKSHKGTMWDFAYDGDGVRVATLITPYDQNGDPQTASWTAYYFDGAYEVCSDSTAIKYYPFSVKTVTLTCSTTALLCL
jgi:hypothetical protein